MFKSTPRKFYALIGVALEYNKAKNGSASTDNAVDGNIEDIKW